MALEKNGTNNKKMALKNISQNGTIICNNKQNGTLENIKKNGAKKYEEDEGLMCSALGGLV